jgi:transaldolase
VVADTGDFHLIEKYQPEDSTTNPTLILQVAKRPDFQDILVASVQFGLNYFDGYCGSHSRTKKKVEEHRVSWDKLSEEQQNDLVELIYDHLCVSFGVKILEKIKGYVSTEVDAKLSFNKNETIKRARRLIALYEQAGVSTDRILIKIATTWEGIKAGEALLKNKIRCNMTLVFHKIQAIACADAKLFLISPFVGRILDWNKKEHNKTYDNPADDPGVQSVTEIYNYYKFFGIKTVVMGASFRSTGEIKELCGCDRLTISPALLEELRVSGGEVAVKLSAEKVKDLNIAHVDASEESFRYEMNKSKMATDLLSQGIRSFEKDGNELKDIIRKKIEELHKPKE